MNHDSHTTSQTHWNLFLTGFRKNRVAVVSLWISVALLYMAAFTPLISNNRPFVMRGTMPGPYARTYDEITNTALTELAAIPKETIQQKTAWQEGRATLADLETALPKTGWRLRDLLKKDAAFSQAADRVPVFSVHLDTGTVALADLASGVPFPQRKTAEAIRAFLVEQIETARKGLEGTPYKSMQQVRRTMLSTAGKIARQSEARSPVNPEAIEARFVEAANRIREKLLPEHQVFLDELLREIHTRLVNARHPLPEEPARLIKAVPAQAIKVLPEKGRIRTAQVISGIRIKLAFLENQLGKEAAPNIKAIENILDALKGVFPADTGAHTPWQARIDEITRHLKGLALQNVQLKARICFPIIGSLAFYDIFFICLGVILGALVVFGRFFPKKPRLRYGLVFGVPAILAIVWGLSVNKTFEQFQYNQEIRTGRIVPVWAIWPPYRMHYRDTVIRLDAVRDGDKITKLAQSPSSAHLLGTDHHGRDMLARLLWGSRISLTVGFVSAGIALLIGVALGAVSGFYRGWVDTVVISRLTEWFMCFPTFFVVITCAFYFKQNIFVIMGVMGLFGWMGIQRLVRGEFLRLAEQDFVSAAIALGANGRRIMFRHILPNAIGPALIAASFGVASAILMESALGFLGLGVQEPIPSWGSLLNQGRSGNEYWLIFAPGFMIFVTVTAYNLVGDGIRDAIDPRLKE